MEFLNETTYVDQAEKTIENLKRKTDKWGNSIPLVTTSKIRNILSMAADIYDKILQTNSSVLDNEIVSRIEYLRVRMIYESGREKAVKSFVEESQLLDYAKMIGTDRKKYLLFYHYLEALIAFHKFNGGKDN